MNWNMKFLGEILQRKKSKAILLSALLHYHCYYSLLLMFSKQLYDANSHEWWDDVPGMSDTNRLLRCLDILAALSGRKQPPRRSRYWHQTRNHLRIRINQSEIDTNNKFKQKLLKIWNASFKDLTILPERIYPSRKDLSFQKGFILPERIYPRRKDLFRFWQEGFSIWYDPWKMENNPIKSTANNQSEIDQNSSNTDRKS